MPRGIRNDGQPRTKSLEKQLVEIEQKIEKLQSEIETLNQQKKEIETAMNDKKIDQIKEMIASCGLTVDEVIDKLQEK